MREVTKQAIKAFMGHKNKKLGGKCTFRYCESYGKVNTEIKDDVLYLFGNAIAKFVNGKIMFRMAGWNSPTTRERLSGLGLSITSIKGVPHIKGQEINTDVWYPLERFVRA